MARVFKATFWQVCTRVIFFEAMPHIFLGLRLAISLSLVVTVVSEMFVGTESGIGQRIYDSYLTNSVITLYSYLIILGIIGYAINKTIIAIEERLIHWVGKR
jgi:NitT/TauT family transport system permease protein